MKYCLAQSWAPLRKEPSAVSEMVTSILFGETCLVTDAVDDWFKVKLDFDQYEGWIPKYYLVEDNFGNNKPVNLFLDAYYLGTTTGAKILLSPGCTLLSENIEIEGETYHLVKDLNNQLPANFENLAKAFLGSPYLWGGRSIWGADCSGFCQVVFKMLNIILPRDAKDQFLLGNKIDFEQQQTGDLAFFESNGKITHVGMVLEGSKIIHAHGKVRMDTLTESGIINSNTGLQTHKLAGIKRY